MNQQLTAKQKAFCEEYSNTFNGTQSYLKVYGGSYETAKARASCMLKLDYIKDYLTLLEKEKFDAYLINAEHIANELAAMAFSKDTPATAKLRAIDLLQKQLGLQQQKINADVNTTTINITVEE